MKRDDLTARQRDVLSFIVGYIDDYGYPPTYREIVTAYGWCGTQAAKCHLDALETKGFIQRDAKKARGLRIVKRIVK